ncbi:hypothetical protein ACFV4N_28035 [Actinosynnema sp. NPDC059797]
MTTGTGGVAADANGWTDITHGPDDTAAHPGLLKPTLINIVTRLYPR